MPRSINHVYCSLSLSPSGISRSEIIASVVEQDTTENRTVDNMIYCRVVLCARSRDSSTVTRATRPTGCGIARRKTIGGNNREQGSECKERKRRDLYEVDGQSVVSRVRVDGQLWGCTCRANLKELLISFSTLPNERRFLYNKCNRCTEVINIFGIKVTSSRNALRLPSPLEDIKFTTPLINHKRQILLTFTIVIDTVTRLDKNLNQHQYLLFSNSLLKKMNILK